MSLVLALIFLCFTVLQGCSEHYGLAIMFAAIGLFVSYGSKHLENRHKAFLNTVRAAHEPEDTISILHKEQAEYSNSTSDFRYWSEKSRPDLEI